MVLPRFLGDILHCPGLPFPLSLPLGFQDRRDRGVYNIKVRVIDNGLQVCARVTLGVRRDVGEVDGRMECQFPGNRF